MSDVLDILSRVSINHTANNAKTTLKVSRVNFVAAMGIALCICKRFLMASRSREKQPYVVLQKVMENAA